MIKLTTLAEKLQEKLNDGNYGFEFNIVTDTGKYKKPYRAENTVVDVVNGRLSINSSDVSTVSTGLAFSTLNCQLKVVLKMLQYDEDFFDDNGELIEYGNISRVESLRNCLDSKFKENSVDPMSNGDKEYIVTTVYSFSQTGTRQQDAMLGDCFVFYANIYYTFVEQGINARNVKFYFDGEEIAYQNFTIYRTPTMDGYVNSFNKNKSAKTIASQSTFSVSFQLPALKNNTCDSMRKYILLGELNQAHFLTIDINGEKQEYLVAFGENTMTGEIVLNVGQTLTLVECSNDYDLLSFPKKYNIYEVTEDQTITFEYQSYIFCVDPSKSGFASGNVVVRPGDIIVTSQTIQSGVKTIWNSIDTK